MEGTYLCACDYSGYHSLNFLLNTLVLLLVIEPISLVYHTLPPEIYIALNEQEQEDYHPVHFYNNSKIGLDSCQKIPQLQFLRQKEYAKTSVFRDIC